jgi:hypothetical protein
VGVFGWVQKEKRSKKEKSLVGLSCPLTTRRGNKNKSGGVLYPSLINLLILIFPLKGKIYNQPINIFIYLFLRKEITS